MSNNSTFISTYAKLFLNEWSVLSGLLNENTGLEGPRSGREASLFTDRQILDAITGPYQAFFKHSISSYALLTKSRINMNNKEKVNDCENLQKKLDPLIQAQYRVWRAKHAEWSQIVCASLEQQDIPLSDLEKQELQNPEAWSQLRNRLIDLNIKQPDSSSIDFKTYFILKATIAIQNSFNRRQEVTDESLIEGILKKIQSVFNTIHDEEKKLSESQLHEIRTIIAAVDSLHTNKSLSLQKRSDFLQLPQ